VTTETVTYDLLREAVSPTGHRITLAIECGRYPGAAPVYVIARHEKKRPAVRQDQRFVPLTYGVLDERHPTASSGRRATAEARAVALFEALAQDVVGARR
jgi:hypothetical protein